MFQYLHKKHTPYDNLSNEIKVQLWSHCNIRYNTEIQPFPCFKLIKLKGNSCLQAVLKRAVSSNA